MRHGTLGSVPWLVLTGPYASFLSAQAHRHLGQCLLISPWSLTSQRVAHVLLGVWKLSFSTRSADCTFLPEAKGQKPRERGNRSRKDTLRRASRSLAFGQKWKSSCFLRDFGTPLVTGTDSKLTKPTERRRTTGVAGLPSKTRTTNGYRSRQGLLGSQRFPLNATATRQLMLKASNICLVFNPFFSSFNASKKVCLQNA